MWLLRSTLPEIDVSAHHRLPLSDSAAAFAHSMMESMSRKVTMVRTSMLGCVSSSNVAETAVVAKGENCRKRTGCVGIASVGTTMSMRMMVLS